MFNYFKKSLSVFLAFCICLTTFSVNIKAEEFSQVPPEYSIISTIETEHGTMYYVEETSDVTTHTLWDVADIFMAGYSWASFFGDISWRSFGWAVLDTAALLPLLPSSAYFREGGKLVVKAEAIADLAKTSKGSTAIKNAIKSSKTMSSLAKAYRISDTAWSHILARHAFNSTAADTTKFFSVVDIKGLIKDTLEDSYSISKYVVGDGKYVIQKQFSNNIGNTATGEALNKIKVILDSNGNVITAYPVKYFQTNDYF